MSAERILIVDDSPTQADAARAILEGQGYHVAVARDGAEGLALAREGGFDLVLTDAVMPRMDGFELCSRIKAELAHPPAVVMLTSLSDPRDIVRGVQCGADNYITKPYEADQLLARVARALDQRLMPDGAGSVTFRFLGETFSIASNPAQMLPLLLSSFEELIHANTALQKSRREIAQAHAREQEARLRAEAAAVRLEALRLEAEEATRARDDVLATVSHDLRNPAGAIFGSASLLLDIPLSEEARKRQFELIRRNAMAMERLIQDLLDVSRMEAGAFSVEPGAESAHALVEEARDLHQPLAASRGVELAVELDQPDVEVWADRGRILQVFSNLLGNALKFTPAGGRVGLSFRADEQGVGFTVSDTGSGIAPEALPHIFDRFWHGREGGGTGLGLAITKGIVEAHGGSITVVSSPAGTTFRFALPPVTAKAGAPVGA